MNYTAHEWTHCEKKFTIPGVSGVVEFCVKRSLLFPVLMFHAGLSLAEDGLQGCLELKASPEARLACYDALARANRPPAVKSAPESPAAQKVVAAQGSDGFALDRLWSADRDKVFSNYRENYLLFFTKTFQPNNAPTSPNPLNRVPYSYALDNKEAKFQVSFKSDVYDVNASDSLWLAYTQQSFWQVYDAAHSRPFQESNYEPEFIYSHRFDERQSPIFGMTPRILNFGLLHQSNGQSLPRSRSWNRVYAETGLEKDYEDGSKLALLVRPWMRIRENPSNDDNPDITHYLGYGDVVMRYWSGGSMYSARVMIRSLQLDWAFRIPGLKGLDLHVQYFTGYGESMIDYNQRHDTLGIGISLPYE